MRREIDENMTGLENGGYLAFVQRFSTDEACRAYLETKRWPNGPVCPHCKTAEATISKLNGKAHRAGVYACGACRRQFTVTIGTIYEASHLPLPKWFAAVYLMCVSKKGVSAAQLQRMLGGSYKTWWFACHRIRLAMRTNAFKDRLSGIVECDETWIGGKERRGKGWVSSKGKRGVGGRKMSIFAMVERQGNVIAHTVPTISRDALSDSIDANIDPESQFMTDEAKVYRGILRNRNHRSVKHSTHIYVEPGGVHTNTIESFFALLKRGVHGTFHHISAKHADLYCGEFSFRYNTRQQTDGQRFAIAMENCDGRLKWNFRKGALNGQKAKEGEAQA